MLGNGTREMRMERTDLQISSYCPTACKLSVNSTANLQLVLTPPPPKKKNVFLTFILNFKSNEIVLSLSDHQKILPFIHSE